MSSSLIKEEEIEFRIFSKHNTLDSFDQYFEDGLKISSFSEHQHRQKGRSDKDHMVLPKHTRTPL